jgi:hypothetical protein
MKRIFLALLMAMVAPAFAQVSAYMDPVAEQTYTVIQQQSPTPIEEIKNTGGAALTLYDDGVSQPIGLGFDFYYYGNSYDSIFVSQNGFISFTSNANGCCSGNSLPFFSDNPYYNMNNSIFAMWSDLADFNAPGNPYYQSFNDRLVVGWYGVEELGTANKFTYEITLFSNNDFSINYGSFDYAGITGRTFTAGFQGDQAGEFYQIYNGNDPSSLENSTYLIRSSTIVLPPPEFLFWNRVAGEYEQFTLTEETVVRYGANGVYAYQTLQAGTYDCGNSIFGDPIGGVVKACEIGTNEPPVVAVDCALGPLDPSCIIDSIVDDVIDDQPMLADEVYTGSDDEEESAVEELFAMVEESFDNPYEEEMDESLEELLAEEVFANDEDEDSIEVVASLSPIKEMADEEKAVTLSDSISKDVLESALSIAAAAETSGASGGSPSESSSSSSSSRSSGMTSGGGSEMSVASAESNFSGGSFDGSGQEQFAAGDASMELLETGRVMGQDALASTMAATEASAIDSMSQAESIAQISSFDSMGTSSTAETINSIEIENVTETVASIVESSIDTSMEMMGMMPENTGDTGVVTDGSDMFGFIENNPTVASVQEAEEIALAVVNNAIASGEQKTFEDEYNPDAEVTNSMVDPALAMANTFNQPPSMMNLEILGIIKPIEEKSDAERSAEKVIAANKEQQEEINKNYMDADQSGIVAAIAVDADVSAYLSARLMDNNAWYKPEDIYKGVIIKDNVRGSYFLEKGNTDTYKKMVEEQYKNE